MTFGRGIASVYEHMTRGLTDEAVDQIDAALGDELAATRVAEVERQERDLAIAASGVAIRGGDLL